MHLGVPELLVVLLLVLLFFGPTRLPQLASSLGEAVRGFKKAANGEHDHAALPPQNGAAPAAQQNPPPQA